MGLAERYIPHYTYEDWVRWEGRWELIEGVPIAMSPMPMPEHQRVSGELSTEFVLALRKASCHECKMYQPIDYKLSDDTILAPDLLVVCGNITRHLLDFPPALVVEILSKSTEERDREIKYEYYEREGVKYYLIVDTKTQQIEIYQLVEGKYCLQPYKNRFPFELNDNCKIFPELDNVWQ